MKNIFNQIAVLLALFLVGCGHQEVVEVDPELQEYLDEFKSEYYIATGKELIVKDIIMGFGELKKDTDLGVCEIGEGTPKVTVSELAFKAMSVITRKALIFHELGHCLLRRMHNSEKDNHGSAVSIMYPYTQSAWALEMNWQALLDELFNEDKFQQF